MAAATRLRLSRRRGTHGSRRRLLSFFDQGRLRHGSRPRAGGGRGSCAHPEAGCGRAEQALHRQWAGTRATDGDQRIREGLAARRTWREFGGEHVSLATIARLLWWVWGVHGWVAHGEGRSALRTSPSAGARQIIEVYLVASRVSGLEPGFYHYEMDRHRLVRLPGRVSKRTLERFIPRQWWFHAASALFVMSAMFKRAQLRYPFPRAYRSALLEAGHFCQTLCLSAEALGLAPFCTHALADRVVEDALGLDGVDESVVYAAGVGHKPPDGQWRPWPDHRARPSLRAGSPQTEVRRATVASGRIN